MFLFLFLFHQYYEFAYIKELAEPSRQLAQKVNQKEKERTDREEGQTNEEKTEEQKEEARDEYVFSLFYVKTKKKY